MERFFSHFAERAAWISGRPYTFVFAVLLVAVWGISGPFFAFSETWQLVINTGTTIITFLMVFLIQNAQNRDIVAVQSKLDELIRAKATARNDFIGLERLSDNEIEDIRQRIEAECKTGDGNCATPDDAKVRPRSVTVRKTGKAATTSARRAKSYGKG